MNRLRLLIVWTATSLVLLFLLHPPIVLEVHDGTRWVGSAAYHEWLWKIPASDTGVRWRADFSTALIASLATVLTAAAAFVTIRAASRPSRPSRPVTQAKPAAAPPHIFQQPPVESSLALAAQNLAAEKTPRPAPRPFGWN